MTPSSFPRSGVSNKLRALQADGIAIADTWIGPALPIGDHFEGIVHLHGSLNRAAQELVLTDEDFGRAYLTYAWATRFLIPMFQEFTVVFVGYSHDDPIMRYLALGLPSRTPRFVFTQKLPVNDPKWGRLGIEPINYPVVGGDHAALPTALTAWAVRSRMGQVEHAAQIRSIVGAGPRMTPVDRDYLLARLDIEEGTREFASATTSIGRELQVAWLNWLEDHEPFKAVFRAEAPSPAANVLASWFCRTFVVSPELNGAALQTVQRLGMAFGDGLFDQLCWSTEELGKSDVDAARRWRAVLATSVAGQSTPPRTELLLPYFAADTVEDNAILRAALKPQLILKRRWYRDDADDLTAVPHAEVYWKIDEHHLTVHLNKLIDSTLAGDPVVMSMLVDALLAAYDLDEAFHSGRADWDGLSFGRSAIEPHEQDSLRTPLDAIIDSLRAIGERALELEPNLATRWWALGRPLFRRLAIHLIARDTELSADNKIQWLLDHDALYAPHLKHEVYQVLAVATSDATKPSRARLLEMVMAGPEYPEDLEDRDAHIAYAKYNLLVWLTLAMPAWKPAQKARRSILRKHPHFGPRDHPDFDTWSSIGDVETSPPMEPAEFIASWRQNPEGALAAFLDRDYSERRWDGPTWHDALGLVGGISQTDPGVGDALWTLMEQTVDLDASKATDMRIAIVEGWARADLPAVDQVVDRLSTLIEQPRASRAVSRFLLDQARRKIEDPESSSTWQMRDVAMSLWSAQSATFSHAESTDPVSMAPLYLNSWPGDLAQYWTAEIDNRWRNHRDDWAGLDGGERAAIEEMLNGSHDTRDATLPALSSEVFFLFAADPDFTTQHIIPLFQRPATARLAWHPYLFHARYNDRLLAAGMLQATIGQWERLDEIHDNALLFRFYGLVASIVSFAAITADDRRTLLDQSVLVDDGRRASDFADAVSRFLREDTINGSEIWVEWLGSHLSNRVNGVPRVARSEELQSWADVVPHLGQHIPDAVELLAGHGIGLGRRFTVPRFPDGAVTSYGALLVEHYAERVRNSSPDDDYSMTYRVGQLVESLIGSLGGATTEPLALAARQRGFLQPD
ncbi:SIR2 family protein [Microbacterium flavum]|uniref:SIR2 family protein n=1 Tax=Microbacterium flavum TaxID=415216 RepID=UPI003556E7C7